MKENDTIESEIAALTGQIDLAASRSGESDTDGRPMAGLYYHRGKLYWKLGMKAEAMSDYARAEALDPQSPAAGALAQARDIMAFFNKDLYNP